MNAQDMRELYELENTSVDTFADKPSFKGWSAEYKLHCTNEVNDNYIEDVLADAENGDECVDIIDEEPTVKVVVVEAVAEPVVEDKTPEYKNRKEHAVAVYKSLMNGKEHPARKDVIDAFVNEVGMSKAGASTYHYNIKKAM